MARCGPHAIVCQALVPKSLGETKSRYEQVPCFHQVVLVPKNPPASAGDVRDEGLMPGEDPLENGMATNIPNILAWRIS